MGEDDFLGEDDFPDVNISRDDWGVLVDVLTWYAGLPSKLRTRGVLAIGLQQKCSPAVYAEMLVLAEYILTRAGHPLNVDDATPTSAVPKLLRSLGVKERSIARAFLPALHDMQAQRSIVLRTGRSWQARWILLWYYVSLVLALAQYAVLTTKDRITSTLRLG